MKKIYWMLLMICSVFVFAACSDDDEGGEPTPQIPVINYKVPASGGLGSDVTLEGKGFTEASEIFLKDAAGKLTQATVKTVTTVDLVFTVPSTLVVGSYTVVLRQQGDWELGKIMLSKTNPITDYKLPEEAEIGKVVAITGKGFANNCEIYLKPDEGESVKMMEVTQTDTGIIFTMPADLTLGTYTLIVRQEGDWELGVLKVIASGVKRLSKIIQDYNGDISTTTLHYDGEGRIDSWRVEANGSNMTIAVDYSIAGKLKLTYSGTNYTEGRERSIEYTLDREGRVESSLEREVRLEIVIGQDGTPTGETQLKADTFNLEWKYTTDGYLEKIVEKDQNSETTVYTYTNNNIATAYMNYCNFQYVYEGNWKNTQAGVDLMAIVSSFFGAGDYDVRLLGVCGKYPLQLPTQVNSADYGNYTVSYTKKGDLITSIIPSLVDDVDTATYTLEY